MNLLLQKSRKAGISHFCPFANSSVTYKDRIPPAYLISGLFCAQISSQNKRRERVFCLEDPQMGNFRVTLQLQLQVKPCFCCGEIPEAPGIWSRPETFKSPALHRCHCLPLAHAPTILPWLVHVVHSTYTVGKDCYCQTHGEMLYGTKLKAVYGVVDECAFVSIKSFPNRKKNNQETKLLFLFFSPSVLSNELSHIYSHTNNQLPAKVSPIGEVLPIYLQYPFLPCPMVRSHK